MKNEKNPHKFWKIFGRYSNTSIPLALEFTPTEIYDVTWNPRIGPPAEIEPTYAF